MKSSSLIVMGIIGALGAYLGYKYLYLPSKGATSSVFIPTSTTSSSFTVPSTITSSISSPQTTGSSILSHDITAGLINSSSLQALPSSMVKPLVTGLGSPITTSAQKNLVSNSLITTAGLTTNTVAGKAYGAKLANASRLVRVMNTESSPVHTSLSSSVPTYQKPSSFAISSSKTPSLSSLSTIHLSTLPSLSSIHLSTLPTIRMPTLPTITSISNILHNANPLPKIGNSLGTASRDITSGFSTTSHDITSGLGTMKNDIGGIFKRF